MSTTNINWIVPLRRAVIKGDGIEYAEVLRKWRQQLRAHAIEMWTWYSRREGIEVDHNDEEMTQERYNQGLATLLRWIRLTFESPEIETSQMGMTTVQTHAPNFHCRLWKGPKRILSIRKAGEDQEKLAKIQPFDIVDGRIAIHYDERGKPRNIRLLPGDVLELPLHEFLVACGQNRFADIQFDPMGSFYLGTSVMSKSGASRTTIPMLHDNMLAMRFQLLTALDMANCYHDQPVYTKKMKPSSMALAPEGGGVFARGMPFGGNSVVKLLGGRWEVSQLNSNIPGEKYPRYLPPWSQLEKFAEGLPTTWGWTCSPFALFLFFFMLDIRKTRRGTVIDDEYRHRSIARSMCLLTAESENEKFLDERVRNIATPDLTVDNLACHNIPDEDIEMPRGQPPIVDFCEILIPENRKLPKARNLTSPGNSRVHTLELPVKTEGTYGVDQYDWTTLCPGAGMIVVSSEDGHEFSLVKLRRPGHLLSIGTLPRAGCLSAYNPLSGDDYFDLVDQPVPDGHFFITESSARMPASSSRTDYANLMLAEVALHKFEPTPGNVVRFTFESVKSGSDIVELRIDEDEDGKFREKKFDVAVYVREGVEGDSDPRTLTNIYGIPRDAWLPIGLKFSSSKVPKDARDFLDGFPMLYAERAVPFPTILEASRGFPSLKEVEQQIENHHSRLIALGAPDAASMVEEELAKASDKLEKERLARDLAFVAVYPDGVNKGKRIHESLRLELVALTGGSAKTEFDE